MLENIASNMLPMVFSLKRICTEPTRCSLTPECCLVHNPPPPRPVSLKSTGEGVRVRVLRGMAYTEVAALIGDHHLAGDGLPGLKHSIPPVPSRDRSLSCPWALTLQAQANHIKHGYTRQALTWIV